MWSYDFVHNRTDVGRVYCTLNIIDEFPREALAIRVDRKLNSINVVDALTDLFTLRGPPAFIRSDNPSRPLLRNRLPVNGQRLPLQGE